MELQYVFNNCKPYPFLLSHFSEVGSEVLPFKTLKLEKDKELVKIVSVGRVIATVTADNTITIQSEGLGHRDTKQHVIWLGLSRLTHSYYPLKSTCRESICWQLHLGFYDRPLIIHHGISLPGHQHGHLLEEATQLLKRLVLHEWPDETGTVRFEYRYRQGPHCSIDGCGLQRSGLWQKAILSLQHHFAEYPGSAGVCIKLNDLTEHERMFLSS